MLAAYAELIIVFSTINIRPKLDILMLIAVIIKNRLPRNIYKYYTPLVELVFFAQPLSQNCLELVVSMYTLPNSFKV